MFNLTAAVELIIHTFDVNVSAGSHTIEIYYRVGSYVGFTSTSSGWILAGSSSVSSSGTGSGTPVPYDINLTIPAGQTYGFYVTTTGTSMTYTNGDTPISNAHMTLNFGYGGAYPFNLTFSSRTWNGTIHYEACP